MEVDSYSLGKNVSKTSISTNKKLGVVVHICHPSYTRGINRRIVVQIGLGINVKPYMKNNDNTKALVHDSSGKEPEFKPSTTAKKSSHSHAHSHGLVTMCSWLTRAKQFKDSMPTTEGTILEPYLKSLSITRESEGQGTLL
jgi:hypothetical protein